MPVRILAPDAPLPPGALPIDARRLSTYRRGHLPGAIHMAWEEWCEPAPPHAGPTLAQPGYWGVLWDEPPEDPGQRLAALGIDSDRPLVVYSGGSRSRGREGRVAWMLLYLGARDVSLLDGGWHVWLEHGGVADTDEPPPKRGRFEIAVQRGRRRTLAELRGGSLPAFIDTRSRAEYEGEIDEYLPRRGHLPGAVLVPFADLFDDRGRYVDRKTLLARLAPDLRGRRDRVAYCEVGVRAALFALLHEALTGEVIPVYDGSLMEWSLDPELPMETGL